MGDNNYEILAIIISQIILQIIIFIKSNANIKTSLKRMETSAVSGRNDGVAQDIYTLVDSIADTLARRILSETNRRTGSPKAERRTGGDGEQIVTRRSESGRNSPEFTSANITSITEKQ